MTLSRVAAVGWLLAVAACTTLRDVQPAQFIPQHAPALVWVTTTNDALVPVAQPYMDGDTLRGKWAGTEKPFAIPLQGVESVQAKRPARAQTALLIATLGLVAGAMIRSVAASGARSVQDQCINPDTDPTCRR
jgi:hypothetical protein